MTSAPFGAPCVSNRRRARRAAALALFGALLLAAAAGGPTWLLRLSLAQFLPRATGLQIGYDRAAAGFLGRAMTVEGLTAAGEELVFSAARIELRGLNPRGWWRLGRGEEGAYGLADSLELTGARLEHDGWSLAVDSLSGRRPGRGANDGLAPLRFHALTAEGLTFQSSRRPSAPEARLGRLEIGSFDPGRNRLALDRLEIRAQPNPGPLAFSLEKLTADGLPPNVWNRLSQEAPAALETLLSATDLKAGPGRLTLGGREALRFNQAAQHQAQPDGTGRGGRIVYQWSLDGMTVPEALRDFLDGYFWADLADWAGGPLALKLEVETEIDPDREAARLQTLRLTSPDLGRLELTAELLNWNPAPFAYGLPQVIASARLAGLTLAYSDQGFLARYYAWLDRRGWLPPADGRSAAERFQAAYLEPLVQTLAEDAGLDNLPALAEEARIFLNRPETMTLAAAPTRPWSLARLARMNRYDIIEKLSLTLTVNGRPPVSPAVAAGVFPETQPTGRTGRIKEKYLPARTPAAGQGKQTP